MRFQVPQFIDIEDKIIGPLTLKQFLTYFSAVLVLIPVYLFSDLSLFLTLALPVFAVAAAFAHFRPGGKSLFVFLGNAVGFLGSSRLWTWRRTKQLKPLPVSGIEFIRARDEAAEFAVPSLAAKIGTIETEGNVSTEDVEDPLTEEKPQVPIPNDQSNPKP